MIASENVENLQYIYMTVLTILKITTKICVFHKALSVLIQIDTYKRYNNCKLLELFLVQNTANVHAD